MSCVNKVMLLGNVGSDLTINQSKREFLSFNLVTKEVWLNKATGKKEQKSDCHNVRVTGKRVNLCKEQLKRGDKVFVEGRLTTEVYNDPKTNETKFYIYVKAQQVRFLADQDKELL